MKSMIIGMGLLFTTTLMGATTINIPDNSFEGLAATVNGPLVGYSSNHIGAWSVEFNVVLGLAENVTADTSANTGGPAPSNGTREAALAMPAAVGASETLSQTLTNKFLPNSVYTLSVDLSEGAIADLASGTTLSLKCGSSPLCSVSGTALATILNSSPNFHTVTLTFKTGNTAPSGNIGIALNSSAVGSLGSIYADNFQLSVQPISVQLGNYLSGTNIVMTGAGGASNGTFVVMGSTNFLEPMANWTPMATNHFDANGNFQINMDKTTGGPNHYYRVLLP